MAEGTQKKTRMGAVLIAERKSKSNPKELTRGQKENKNIYIASVLRVLFALSLLGLAVHE